MCTGLDVCDMSSCVCSLCVVRVCMYVHYNSFMCCTCLRVCSRVCKMFSKLSLSSADLDT